MLTDLIDLICEADNATLVNRSKIDLVYNGGQLYLMPTCSEYRHGEIIATFTENGDSGSLATEARSWLLDCFGHDDASVIEIELLDIIQAVSAVDRYFVGGITEFLRSSFCLGVTL